MQKIKICVFLFVFQLGGAVENNRLTLSDLGIIIKQGRNAPVDVLDMLSREVPVDIEEMMQRLQDQQKITLDVSIDNVLTIRRWHREKMRYREIAARKKKQKEAVQFDGAAGLKITLTQANIDAWLIASTIHSEDFISMNVSMIRSQCKVLGYENEDIEKLLRKRNVAREKARRGKRKEALVNASRCMSYDITDSDIDIMKHKHPLALEQDQVKRVLEILISSHEKKISKNDYRQNALLDLKTMSRQQMIELAVQYNVSCEALLLIQQRALAAKRV